MKESYMTLIERDGEPIVQENTGEVATFSDDGDQPFQQVLRLRFQLHPVFKNMGILPVQVFKYVFQPGIALHEVKEQLKNPSAADGVPEHKQPETPGSVCIVREVTVFTKTKK
jgi:hypothetical protein